MLSYNANNANVFVCFVCLFLFALTAQQMRS